MVSDLWPRKKNKTKNICSLLLPPPAVTPGPLHSPQTLFSQNLRSSKKVLVRMENRTSAHWTCGRQAKMQPLQPGYLTQLTPGLRTVYSGHRTVSQGWFDLKLCLALQPLPPPPPHRLVGLAVKASASGAEDPGFKSRLRRDFSRGQVKPVTWKLTLQCLPC